MSVLANAVPDGWAVATIPDLVGARGIFADGDWVETKDQNPKGEVRLTQLADVGDGGFRNRSVRFMTSAKAKLLGCTFLEVGDVLVARMPDPLGRACIFPGDPRACVTVVDVCVIRPGPESVLPQWLMWAINSPQFRNHVEEFKRGSTRKRISRRNLAAIPLPVPPLPEQHRIVAEIETQFTRLDAALAALERVRANLKRYRAATLAAACEGRLVTTEAEVAHMEGREFQPAHALLEEIGNDPNRSTGSRRTTPADRDDAPNRPPAVEVPAGWSPCVIGQLVAHGPQNGLYRPASDYGDGVPILRIDDYQDDLAPTRESLRRLRPRERDVEIYGLLTNDLVLNRVNSPSHLGKCVVVKGTLLPCLFESNMMRMRFSAMISPDWIAIYLRSGKGRARLTANAKWAVNQASINQRDVCTTPVMLPPLAEQHRIVAEVERRLSLVDKLESVVYVAQRRAAALRQSILKCAFDGKLVPQDPDDEPASVLLERIRAERAAVSANGVAPKRAARKKVGA